MQIPLQITLRNLARSEAVDAEIRKRADKLERFHQQIVSCRVVVELPSRHKHQGKEFVVRLDIKVPGSEIVVNHDHHEDLYVALHEAFDAAQRRLEDHARTIDARHNGHRSKRLEPPSADT
jgi:ribosomal subunit interface protein